MTEPTLPPTALEITVPGLGTFTITSDAKGLPGTNDGWWVYNNWGLRLVQFATREEAVRAVERISTKACEVEILQQILRRAERELDVLWTEGAIWK